MIHHYGNLELAEGHVEEASRRYNEALGILKLSGPTHRFTLACYYKLGVVAARQGKIDEAL